MVERLRFRREAAAWYRRGTKLHRKGSPRFRSGRLPRTISGKEAYSTFVDDRLQPPFKLMRKPLLYSVEQWSVFPLLQPDLVGLRKIPGKHLLHFLGEFLAQN